MTPTRDDRASGPRTPLPPLGPPDAFSFPHPVERRLETGLRVVAVPSPGASVVEVRVQIPWVASGPEDTALAELLAATAFVGTTRLGDREVVWDTALDTGRFQTRRTSEWVILAGHCGASELPLLLDLLAGRLRHPFYPDDRVRQESLRIGQAATILRTQPRRTVLRELNRIRYGPHGCFDELPHVDTIARLTAQDVAEAHRRFLVPGHADLLIVGGIEAEAAAAMARTAFAGWHDAASTTRTDPGSGPHGVPAASEAAGTEGAKCLIARPGAAQSHLALSLPARAFEDSRYPAQAVANAVFAGYFSSRLVSNIREDKGFTYHVNSRFDRTLGKVSIVVEATCATTVTERTVEEILAETLRMVTDPPSVREIEDARRFLSGSLLMAAASPPDLANLISTLGCWGIGLDWIERYPHQLLDVTVADVAHVSREVFGSATSAPGVVVGDAEALSKPLERFGYPPANSPAGTTGAHQ